MDVASVAEGWPVATVEIALDCVLRRRLTSVRELSAYLMRYGRGRKGSSVLRRLVADRDQPSSESPLETRFLSRLRRSGLPLPRAQYEIHDNGRFVARVDFCYPEPRLLIEIDGYRYHCSRAAWRNDLTRQNRLVSLGWTVLRFGQHDLDSAPSTIRRFLATPGTGSVSRVANIGGQ